MISKEALIVLARKAKVFYSLPYIPDLSPACFDDLSQVESRDDYVPGLERRSGYFSVKEAALSVFDHGNLYGDGVFEGIKVVNRRVVLLREHIDRWFVSASKLSLIFPFGKDELAEIILELVRKTLGSDGQNAYLRPVLTRGLGSLAVGPESAISPTVYIICADVSLYPDELYEKGIELAIARKIRRNTSSNLDPTIKSLNYLNNILIRLEKPEKFESLFLTPEGYVSEASADNIFVIETGGGKALLRTPKTHTALKGLTRSLTLECAEKLGMDIECEADLLPTDLVGPNREMFMTGTACGLMPVIRCDGLDVGDAKPGIWTRKILRELRQAEFDSGTAIDCNISGNLS